MTSGIYKRNKNMKTGKFPRNSSMLIGKYPRNENMKTGKYPRTMEMRKNLSEVRKKLFKEGKLNHSGGFIKGHKVSEEIKEKMRIAKRNMSLETRNKMGETRRRLYAEGKLISQTNKEEFLKTMQSEEVIKKRIASLVKRPTNPEKIVAELIAWNNLPFIYTGDGKVLIAGFNPDFLAKELKKVIEVNGDYWHNTPEAKEKDKRKYGAYKNNGYDVLVLWENEIKADKTSCLAKINNFIQVNQPIE